MKRTVTTLCSLTLAFTLAACAGGQSTSSSAVAEEPKTAEAKTPVAAQTPESPQEADTKQEDSGLLAAVWKTMDPKTGVHLNYEEFNESMDTNSIFDVHSKDEVYYSKRTTQVSGIEGSTITMVMDGKAINLNEEKMTGTVATSTGSMIGENPLLMDDLYSAIWQRLMQGNPTVEQRELNGTTYTVEYYPAPNEYKSDGTFYFDADGKLVYFLDGALSAGGYELGETLYTIHSIDADVNGALFDISAYTVEGL